MLLGFEGTLFRVLPAKSSERRTRQDDETETSAAFAASGQKYAVESGV
jgi:hypothetical protein